MEIYVCVEIRWSVFKNKLEVFSMVSILIYIEIDLKLESYCCLKYMFKF